MSLARYRSSLKTLVWLWPCENRLQQGSCSSKLVSGVLACCPSRMFVMSISSLGTILVPSANVFESQQSKRQFFVGLAQNLILLWWCYWSYWAFCCAVFFWLRVGQITLSLRTTECLANTVCRIVDSHDCPCCFSFCTNTLACPKSCCFYVDSLYSASGFGLLAMWTSFLNCAGSCVPEYLQIKPIAVGWICCCCAYGYYWNDFCL